MLNEPLTVTLVTDSYDYDAFGNKINSTGTTPNNFLYRGEFFDSDLELYYLRARYYSPLTGRFVGRDPNDPELFRPDGYPTDPSALHKYLYAGGDPVNRIDPSGRGDLADYFFARGTGVLNTNAYVRLGFGWNNVIKCVVFRLAIGSAGALIHWHYDFWDYCP